MPERSSLTQTVQWGVESGSTSAAANIAMSAMGFEPSPTTQGGKFRPAGRKYPTLAWISKEWSEGSLSGQATYTEMIYPLASVLSAPTTAKPTSGSYMYTFTSSPSGADSPKTFTIEQGESTNFNRLSGVIINEMGLSFTRDEVQLSGSAFGKAMAAQTTGMTTASVFPTSLIVLPAEVTVQWSTTYATVNLATTASPGTGSQNGRLQRVLSADINIGDRYNPVWVLDSTQSSYVASVEGEPTLTGKLLMEADSEGMARLAEMKAATTGYLRIRAESGTYADTQVTNPIKNIMLLEMAAKVSDTGGYSDQDGVYAIEWNLTGIYDSTFGGVIRAKLINAVLPSTLVSGADFLASGTYGAGLMT